MNSSQSDANRIRLSDIKLRTPETLLFISHMERKIKIAVFDAKPYDIESFNTANMKFNYNLKYFGFHLTSDNIVLTQGFDAIIIIGRLKEFGVKLIALRSSGFNNVDLKAALNAIKVVRVPAYSPYAIAEHTVALMLTLNRKIHRAYFRTRDTNFSLNGLLGFDVLEKYLLRYSPDSE